MVVMGSKASEALNLRLLSLLALEDLAMILHALNILHAGLLGLSDRRIGVFSGENHDDCCLEVWN